MAGMPVPAAPNVRQATPSDVAPLSAALARSFEDDPVLSWIFPADRHVDRLRRYFAMYLAKVSLRHGITYTTDDRAGGAIWLPPGHWELSTWDMVRTLPSSVAALGRKLPFALRTLVHVERRHPKAPHYYLATLGTDPPHQGKGVGGALLQPMLDRCDTEGLPAYLESSKERNIPFYARHGFTVTDELDLPGGGPRIWLMWRAPREPQR
jgi:GNAT superfamily N-acetyltransferase